MYSKLSSSRYLLKSGGWSTILSGLIFGVVTVYIYGVLGSLDFQPLMFDDHTLLHPWVSDHIQIYRLTWILYFLTQLVLLPLPQILAHHFQRRNGARDNKALNTLAEISKTFGNAAITLAALCPILFYAASPLTAQAYMADTSSQSKELVLVMSSLMTDIPKEIRLFSEVFLGIWLVLTGYLFCRSVDSKPVGWLTLIVGIWTLSIVSVKIFNPASPFEDFLGLVLAVNYVVIGMHLLKAITPKKTSP